MLLDTNVNLNDDAILVVVIISCLFFLVATIGDCGWSEYSDISRDDAADAHYRLPGNETLPQERQGPAYAK